MSSTFVSVALWAAVNLVHVAGHVVATRLFKVTINRISFGLGPTLVSWTVGDTTFRLAFLPIAFIVRLRAPVVDGHPAPERDLSRRPLLVQAAVFGSAPLAVLWLALVCAFWLNSIPREVADPSPTVGGTMRDGPAERAGLLPGDIVRSVAGQRVAAWGDISLALSAAPDGPVGVELERNGKLMQLSVEPEQAPEANTRRIGISALTRVEPAPELPARLAASFATLSDIFIKMGAGIVRGFVSEEPYGAEGGPVALHAEPQATSAVDEQWYLATSATIVIADYFLKCLYFPYLDGVKLLAVGLAALRRTPFHQKSEQRLNWLLLALIGLLVLDVLKNDFVRLLR